MLSYKTPERTSRNVNIWLLIKEHCNLLLRYDINDCHSVEIGMTVYSRRDQKFVNKLLRDPNQDADALYLSDMIKTSEILLNIRKILLHSKE